MELLQILLSSIGMIIGALVGVMIIIAARKKSQEADALLLRVQEKSKNMKRDIENERREALLKVKDEIYKKRNEFDLELKRERLEFDKYQSKLSSKYELLEKKETQLDDLRNELQQKERKLSRMSEIMHANEEKLKALYSELITKLENVGGMSKEQAKKELFETLQSEVQVANEKWIQKVEEEARQVAKEKSSQLVVSAMQRYAADHVAAHSSSIVQLPSEEMKGRIIGKEGRNIKSLEMATGMEFVNCTMLEE